MHNKTFIYLLFLILLFSTIRCTNSMPNTQLDPHLYKSKLQNGLTTIVKETPGTKVATLQIWVKAGSIYEEPNEAGITHLIEHMIFKGTPSFGPGEFAETLEGLGGRINAYTSYEYTVYHATLSARHWQKTLEVLSDAVLNSTFDPQELEREKKVVIEEIGMRRDRPTTRLFEKLMASTYTIHPYRLPIIGSQESVSSFSRDDILNYMKKHYHPENFTVVVVGDVNADEVTAKVKNLMGGIAKSSYRQPPFPQELPQESPRFFTIKEDVKQTHMAVAFPISRFDSPDTPALDVLANILGQGETSRLYNQLRNKKGLVYSVDGVSFTPRDPGLLEIMASLETSNILPTLEAMLDEIFKLRYAPVSEEELNKAKLNIESEFIFNLEQVEGQARVLGSFEFLANDPREKEYLERLRAVTAADIIRVATTYFSGERMTAGVIVPSENDFELDSKKINAVIERAEKNAAPAQKTSAFQPTKVADTFLPDIYKFTLKNGVRVIVREDPNIPTVAIRAVFPGGLRGETPETNGAFAFINELLPKGTEKLSAREFSLRVANMAGDISGFNGKNTFGVKADFLSRFFEEGMELVRDVIRTPAFSAEETEKIRPELLAQLKNQEDSLPSLAMREFSRMLFKEHPYGLNTVGAENSIKKLSAEGLKSLYQKHAQPENLVIAISGDITSEKVQQTMQKLFGDWQSSGNKSQDKSFQLPVPPPKPEKQTIDRDRSQSHIIIGFLGSTVSSADRYPLEVLDALLSGQSGRLFTELRDKKSLAYSLSSFSLLGIDTGSFGIYIGTSPDKKEEAIKEIWKQLNRIRTEKVGDNELQRARNAIIGNYELGLQTHGSQAMDMALLESYDLGLDFGTRYINEIENVTPEKIMAVAQKYIQPDHYIMVTVGANSNGK